MITFLLFNHTGYRVINKTSVDKCCRVEVQKTKQLNDSVIDPNGIQNLLHFQGRSGDVGVVAGSRPAAE